MLADKLPISLWMLGFALIGSGIDYIRTREIDRGVLGFFCLAGLVTGAVFQYASRWGDGAGLIGALAAMAVVGVASWRFIRERIISLERKKVSEEDQAWYKEFQEEVAHEREVQGAAETRRPSGSGLSRKRRRHPPGDGRKHMTNSTAGNDRRREQR